MAVTNIEQEILDWYNVNDTGETADTIHEIWDEFYDNLHTKEYAERNVGQPWGNVPVLPSGPVYLVEDFGGEGQGETRYVVFSVGEQFFQVDGYYASWDGTTWEDPIPYEVAPKEVVVIRYEAV